MGCDNSATLTEAAAIEGVIRLLGDIKRGHLCLHDVRQKAAMALQTYGAYAAEQLAEADVGIPPAVNLRTAEDGRVEVVGMHPQCDTIALLFASNPKLLKGLKEIEVLHEIIRTEEVAVQQRYEHRSDPETTAMLVAVPPSFNLGLTSGGPIVFFSAAPT
ncbi:hypothetical protein [Chitinivorax sp. B]|uniref:hypothetical protein n=1 Tax=Chitinivorax sp. B TaxID=2502235 RepID=UPI001484F694|nr:hypothetical protein [Chitinivorax sp. B]